MPNNLGYKVFPKHASKVTPSKVGWRDVEGIGDTGIGIWWSVLIVCIVISIYVFGTARKEQMELAMGFGLIGGFFLANITVIIIHLILKRRNISQTNIRYSFEANEKESRRVIKEADNLTLSLLSTYEQSLKLRKELSEHLEETFDWLKIAKNEYRDNAFSPFWDAVEYAARHLATFREKTQLLSQKAEEYYKKLKGENHNFPAFPVKPETIPSPSSALKKFRRVFRLGLTNRDFALIWEHYKDRKVLIAGFNSLGKAFNNIEYVVEDSIDNFQQSMSSDLAKVVEEQIKTRESINKTKGKQLE